MNKSDIINLMRSDLICEYPKKKKTINNIDEWVVYITHNSHNFNNTTIIEYFKNLNKQEKNIWISKLVGYINPKNKYRRF